MTSTGNNVVGWIRPTDDSVPIPGQNLETHALSRVLSCSRRELLVIAASVALMLVGLIHQSMSIYPYHLAGTIWKNDSYNSGNQSKMNSAVHGRGQFAHEQYPPSVHFVPFPHRGFGFGAQASCQWTANNPGDPIALSLLGSRSNTTPPMMDIIQTTALRETNCILQNATLQSQLRLFSAKQAQSCLVENNITLLISGDSYNRQLFIGLVDILTSRPSDSQLRNYRIRKYALEESQQFLLNQTNLSKNLLWECERSCRGDEMPFHKTCSRCLNYQRAIHSNVVAVVGAAVHIRKGFHHNHSAMDHDATVEELERFFTATEMPLIFNSMPSYDMDLVPERYKAETSEDRSYHELLPRLHHYREKIRFLDFAQMTAQCKWKNCSYDGGHRFRFVNRWKAQMVLNTICSINAFQ